MELPGAACRGALAVLLLICSNTFMTTAWYLHLKIKEWPMLKAVIISWGIAFFEYCLQVPANRLGHAGQGGPFTAPQLKVIQEFVSLLAFSIFSMYVLRERLRWADLGAFLLIFSGVVLSLSTKLPASEAPTSSDLAPPPHRGLLQLADRHALKHHLPGPLAQLQAGLGGGKYTQIADVSEDFEGTGAPFQAQNISDGEGVEVQLVGVAHSTESEVHPSTAIHRMRPHSPQQGEEPPTDNSQPS